MEVLSWLECRPVIPTVLWGRVRVPSGPQEKASQKCGAFLLVFSPIKKCPVTAEVVPNRFGIRSVV